MKTVVLAFVVLLTACATQQLNRELQGMVGQDIHVAIAQFGYPDGTREVMGDTLYVWSSSHEALLPFTTASTTTGTYGYSTTTNTQMMPVNANCTIQLAVNADGTIKGGQWEGNQMGCRRYVH